MANYIINGGRKLKGEITTNSAKNSAVAILCATAMIKGKTTLKDVPRIEEVNRIIEILESIGIKIKWTDKNKLKIINNNNINWKEINKDSFLKTRSALLLMGALTANFDSFDLPMAGGCQLGRRTVTPYLIALDHLRIKVDIKKDIYHITKKKACGKEFTMYESGDTATENTIMAAVTVPGTTKINFASSNYMVQDLCHFLNQAGAKIEGIGTHRLKITGVKNLKPVENYSIMPNPIESMAFISAAITTGSKLKINGCPIDFLQLELEKLRVMGQKFKINPPYKSKSGNFNLVDIEIHPSKLKALPDKIYARPYPGLNLDNLPLFLPILTQAHGQTLVHDWAYENRAIYYTELNRLGAKIALDDIHRVTVTGPSKLKPTEMICPPALRPAITLLICMLAAKGQSVLRNSYAIDRGYENIYERLNKIGADIKEISENN